MMRTHGAGELRVEDAGQSVTLCGWVHHLRDHKGVTFIDLRDASGAAQVVFHPEDAADASERARELQREYCVLVEGEVAKRPSGAENPRLPTGAIEVRARRLEVLSESATPPFVVEDDVDADEPVRLRYRYLDLRRPAMQRLLRLRHSVTRIIRDELDTNGFVEIETPYLNRPTPEGARDFLVPSRIAPGTFWALLQSPQLFKQLLMVAGFERYYSLPRCFRDEDLRADRQYEFTQLDLEMSFVEETDIQTLMERLMQRLWREIAGIELATPFLRMAYPDAIERYGSDKPDLRFGMQLVDVAAVFADTKLSIFKRVLESGGVIKGIAVPGGGDAGHSHLRKLEQQAMERGAKGLAWVVLKEGGGVESPLEKHLSEAERGGLSQALGAGPGDLVLMVADRQAVADTVLGALRVQLARERGLVPDGEWRFVWIVDPPLLEWSDEQQRLVAVHHPFTSPQTDSMHLLESDPAKAKARAYDLVVNGIELGGGSIRIHRPDVQEQVFSALGIDRDLARKQFGFLLDALTFGPPPHGGIAFGLDRIAMVLGGAPSIRDVIAFPKVQSGDLMTEAPGEVDPAQLAEVNLTLKPAP